MAASLSINALQVDFASVLSMEHAEMAKMFKSLEDTGLNGFLGVNCSVFEGVVIEFFSNVRVIAGVIVSFVANRKMVVTKDVFVEAFGFPTEGMGTKQEKEMKIAGSFDVVTSENLDLMVGISSDLKVNRAHVLFQTLVAMLNPLKVLNKKSIHTYMKKNQSVVPAGETSKLLGDTASENRLTADNIRDKVEQQLHLFDQWCRFRTGYRLKKVTSMKLVEEFAKVEDILLSWAETEKFSELFQRRELIWFKMVEQHMRHAVAEHWKVFHKDKPSANQYIISIHLPEDELAKTRRSVSLFQAKAGLPITFNERSTDRVASLEITSGLTWQEYQAQLAQLSNSTSNEQQGKEHQAPEQTAEKQPAQNNEDRPYPASGLPIIRYTAHREENNSTDEEEDFAQTGPQPISFSRPQADFDVVNKLKEVQRVVVSLDSKAASMDSKVVSLDSKVDKLMDIQTFMKHDTSIFKRAFIRGWMM
ncbi:pentatricopeptide repeat-containing protein mitochondrial-like [Dorcoceras hygrometricum]|uniref:Pentatricopeptide repeat-containing protein mitochondrial-like n=1 Tax=Dorcoceras hygrometricum TaxID=472368 RepID=A0A2Z7C3V0_9LAMI|nr:pentatricopeptide repeat-containing protein mitochondrial-like [Dorcoceras hygrometricum]